MSRRRSGTPAPARRNRPIGGFERARSAVGSAESSDESQTEEGTNLFGGDDDSSQHDNSNQKKFSKKKHRPLRKGYEIGEIPELGTNVFEYGNPEKYNKTMDALQKYVKTKRGMDQHNLLKHGTKKDFGKEPEPPKPKKTTVTRSKAGGDQTQEEETQPTNVEIQKWRAAQQRWHDKTDEYEQKMEGTFVDLGGQCTIGLQQKMEADSDWADIEKDTDVIKLKEIIKKCCYERKVGAYKPYNNMKAMKDLYTTYQRQHEDLNEWHSRFDDRVKHNEAENGPIVIGNREAGVTEEQAREQHLACLFLDGADRSKYSKVAEELHNLTLANAGKWPQTVVEMKEYMSKRASTAESHRKSGSSRGNYSFAQTDGRKGGCWYCGSTEHYKKDCPQLAAARADR